MNLFLFFPHPSHHFSNGPSIIQQIGLADEQVAQWEVQSNATLASPPEPTVVLKVPMRNLLTSICHFVPCDRIVQRAY